MHEEKLLHGLENPWLQEGSNGLPLGGPTREKSLEEITIPAGFPQECYQWIAWTRRKRFVRFVCQFGVDFFDMQGEK